MIFAGIAQPTKEHLEDVYGKPTDVGVTRWLSTAIPEKAGSLTQKGLETVGFKKQICQCLEILFNQQEM